MSEPITPTMLPRPEDSAATLARWRAEEAAVRARLQGPGIARPEQIAGLTGLEWFAAVNAGQLPAVPICVSLGFWPMEFEHGRFVFQGHTDAAFLNPLGSLHGGWIATLLDSAVAFAVQTTLPMGAGQTTLELKVSFVRALTLQVPLVRAEGRVINSGRQIGFAEGRLFGPDGKLYAHATTTCMVLKRG